MLVLAGAVVLSSRLLGDALTTSSDSVDRPESARAAELIEEMRGRSTDTEFVLISAEAATVDDPAYMAYVSRVQDALQASEAVIGVGSYLTGDGPVSETGRTALLPVVVAGQDPGEISANAGVLKETVSGIESLDGYQALVAGPATLNNDFDHIAEEDLATGETIGIGVALVVLVLVFGSVASGLVPIVLGMVAIAIALGLAALVGQVFDLNFFVTQMISMIGLAVGIDYSLFIVSRYKEELADGLDKITALERAGATASRAVLFSGLTVVLSLGGLLILPNTLFRSLGIGAILVVVVSVIASMTLLPAVLSIMGAKIDALKLRRRRAAGGRGRIWDRVTRLVMRRPVVSLVVSAGILSLAATSFFSIETGLAGVSTLPDDVESKQAFEIFESEFSGGFTAPAEIVVKGGDVEGTASALSAAIAADGGYGPTSIDPSSTDGLAVLSVQLLGDVNSVGSDDAIRHLRMDIVPSIGGDSEVLVGGETASTVDFLTQVDDYTPIVFAVVLGLSFTLLMVAFRSIVIPGKAIAMNLLSVGAAYGLVVIFFQAGVGPQWVKDISSFLGFGQVETIEAWLPLVLFAILFGLSMDYHVFLLSRMKERFERTGDNSDSVAYGLRTTGALITGAAAIMVAVFGGFAAGRLTTLQQMGFGLAISVLLDATIVRSVLVPASMKMLGKWNWYFPTWLEWVPNVSVEAARPELLPIPEPEPATA
ncbi:MAG TPA: MMPL family transporter [Acidimicrobiia bacterium]|nr:MMPL family transporter [Acidimicrobiia bacterium]